MYESHFGCRENPFRMTPDPRFFFANGATEEAFAMLRYAVEGRKGFALLTGEVGTGKTTLLRRLMAELGDTPFVLLFNPKLGFDEMLAQILDELELPPPAPGRRAAIAALNAFLLARASAGGTTALLIDEAQNLSEETLEEIRLLSNLETDGEKLLQIVLVGQLELEAMLAKPTLRQLRQRIALRARLLPLSTAEVGDLVRHRLRVAGVGRSDVFDPRALALVARSSRGLPRLVNVICDNAMLSAYADSRPNVRESDVREAANDMDLGDGRDETAAAAPGRDLGQALRLAAWTATQKADHRAVPRSGSGSLPWVVAGVVGAVFTMALATDGGADLLRKIARSGIDLVGARPAAGRIADEALARAPEAPSAARAVPKPPRAEKMPLPAERRADPAAGSAAARPTAALVVALAPTPTAPAVHPTKSAPLLLEVRAGLSMLTIAAATYGSRCGLGLDLMQAENPEILDVNRIRAGEILRVPRLDRTRLARERDDGTWEIVITTVQNPETARAIARKVERESGRPARVEARILSRGLALHRVVVGGIAAGDLDPTWRALARSGWVPEPAVPARLASLSDRVGAVCAL